MRCSSQDSFYVPGDARLVSGALQYAGSYTCVRDAFIDIAHEHFHHEFGTAQHGTGPTEMKIVRRIVIGIDPRGNDDIDFCLLRDLLDAWNVAPKANHREIDNGIHAFCLKLVQALYGVPDSLLFGAPVFGIVLKYLRVEHEHMLVHQRGAQMAGINGTSNCMYLRHAK